MCRVSCISLTLLLCLFVVVSGKISTRCFVCRSRGELGDCKDPFANNSTSIQELPGKPVTVTSCASGWCRKQMEGIRGPGDDFGAATERACLPMSPPDGEERCAEVRIRNKVTLLCVCRGDLCNSSMSLRPNFILPLLTGLALSLLSQLRSR